MWHKWDKKPLLIVSSEIHFISVILLSVIICGDLNPPLNGQVTTTTLQHGGMATYVCDIGYVVEGEATRECEGEGMWSGNAPVCRSKSFTLCIAIKYHPQEWLMHIMKILFWWQIICAYCTANSVRLRHRYVMYVAMHIILLFCSCLMSKSECTKKWPGRTAVLEVPV